MRLATLARILLFFCFLTVVFFLILPRSSILNPARQGRLPRTVILDSSILQQSGECTFPCWNGLTPGVSTIADAKQAMPHIPVIAMARNFEEHTRDSQTAISWWTNNPNSASFLIFRNDLLHSIGIRAHTDFVIEDVLEIYGPPQGYKVEYSFGVETGEEWVNIVLYYPREGLIVDFRVYYGPARFSPEGYPPVGYPLLASSPGNEIRIYQQADTIDEFMKQIYGPDVTYEGIFTDWPGIGAMLQREMAFP